MERHTSLRERRQNRADEIRARRVGRPGVLCQGDQDFDGFAMLREWLKPEHDNERVSARHTYYREVHIEDGEEFKAALLKTVR